MRTELGTKMRALAASIVAAAALLAGACGDGDTGAEIDTLHLDPTSLVLEAADLPASLGVQPIKAVPVTADLAAYDRFAADPNTRVEDLVRWGRLRGFVREFDNSQQPNREGELFIASEAEVYRSARGAKEAFSAHRDDVEAGSAGRLERVDTPPLGDESVAFRVSPATRSETDEPVEGYLLLWRRGPVLAFLRVSLTGGILDLKTVLEIAHRADSRLARQVS